MNQRQLTYKTAVGLKNTVVCYDRFVLVLSTLKITLVRLLEKKDNRFLDSKTTCFECVRHLTTIL